jgi:hypothetical protein
MEVGKMRKIFTAAVLALLLSLSSLAAAGAVPGAPSTAPGRALPAPEAASLLTPERQVLSWAGPINAAGYYKNIRLCGKVKVVQYNADIRVEIVNSFPDLRVKVVEHFPDRIGEWQFVEYGEDFTVQFVNSCADLKIKYVDSFPGVN